MLKVVGISYQKTPLNIREKIIFSDTTKRDLHIKLLELGINDAVILATCNRNEIYYLSDKDNDEKIIEQLIENFFAISLKDYFYEKVDEEAIKHLFKVACGLDSQIIGEDQILGQLVEAHEFSMEDDMSHKQMNYLMKSAIHLAKQIKNQYKLSEHALSASYIGIKKLQQEFGLKNRNVLVIGSGKMSELCLPYLFENEVLNVYNANRSKHKAEKLQIKYPKLKVVDFDDVEKLVNEVDIIISATSCPHTLLKDDGTIDANRELAMLDLALPRDIDETFSEYEQVLLYDLDDLNDIAKNNEVLRKQNLPLIEKRINEEVKLAKKWLASCIVDSTIKTIQEKIDDLVNNAYQFLCNKINMNDREKYILKKTLNNNLQRLMHDPLVGLKEADENKQQEYNQMVKELFKMGENNEI